MDSIFAQIILKKSEYAIGLNPLTAILGTPVGLPLSRRDPGKQLRYNALKFTTHALRFRPLVKIQKL